VGKNRSSTNIDIEQHSIGKSITLHLLPGVLGGAVYFLVAQPVQSLGYPTLLALILAIIAVLIPIEIGVLLYEGRKRNGKLSLNGIVLFRERIPVWQYLVLVPLIFILTGALFMILAPLSSYLLDTFFSWIPESLIIDMGLSGAYTKSILVATYLLGFVFVTLAGPIVEELYFRGYLLPRMTRLKGWAPVLNSGLFALYHIWTPWMAVTRSIGLLPLIYTVQRKRNIYIGVVVHCLANSLDIITGVSFILSLS
jgi:membrane protease YdiL (CAAX protease family)